MSDAKGRWDPIDVEVDTPASLGLKEGGELRVVPSANKYGAVSGALYRLNILLVRGILSLFPAFFTLGLFFICFTNELMKAQTEHNFTPT